MTTGLSFLAALKSCYTPSPSVDFSTRAGALETLPFRLLYSAQPALLTHPATTAALSAVLESPLLKFFEACVNSAIGFLAPVDPVAPEDEKLVASRQLLVDGS